MESGILAVTPTGRPDGLCTDEAGHACGNASDGARAGMRRRAAEATQEPDPIAAPEPASRAALAYRALRRAIIEQALRPGSKLPEDAIGEQLGVSRTLVREALSRLSAEGLVELRHNRGATVAYPSLEEARDVFAIRQAMERLVAEQLAPRVTPERSTMAGVPMKTSSWPYSPCR